MLKRAREGKRLEGLRASRGLNAFFNLQYANNTLQFDKCDIAKHSILNVIFFNL